MGSPRLHQIELQMALLSAGEALLHLPWKQELPQQCLDQSHRQSFHQWTSVFPEQHRHPGDSCLSSCHCPSLV